MKAIEFMLARASMCKYYGGVMGGCTKKKEKCPLSGIDCDISADMSVGDAEQMQAIVEKWLNRNGETNKDKFLEVFGMDWTDVYSMNNVNAETWSNQKYERG